MTTVLTLVQNFTDKMNLPTPTALVGSQEKSIRQYRALLRELVADLAEYRWSQQRLRLTWPSVLGQDQGLLTSIFGAGYYGLEKDTMWNESRRMRIYGPLPDQIWQALQVLPNAGPEFQFWISGGHLYVSPAQVVGETLSVVYTTTFCVQPAGGGAAKQEITVDSDTLLFPDNVVQHGLEYKWRKQKGDANWQDVYNDFMSLLARNIVKEGAAVLSLAESKRLPQPGIVIPAGSWNV